MSTKVFWHTFEGSGAKLLCRRVNPALMLQLRKLMPEPKPPMNEVDGFDGKKRLEPNPDDPAHQAALNAYNADFEMFMRFTMCARGIVEINAAQRVEVEELQQTIRLGLAGRESTGDMERNLLLSGDAKAVYGAYIAIAAPEDGVSFYGAITGRPDDPKLTSGTESSTFESGAALSDTTRLDEAA
jgi:hypothetical protein